MKYPCLRPLAACWAAIWSVLGLFGCHPRAVETGWRALQAGDLTRAESIVKQGLRVHRESAGLWDLSLRICLLRRTWKACPLAYRKYKRFGGSRAARWGLELMVQQSLWAGMKSKKVEERRKAARTARDLGVTGIDKVLVDRLSDPDPLAAVLAAGAVWVRSEKARAMMEKWVNHSNDSVRQELAAGLGFRPTHRLAARVLVEKLANDGYPGVRVEVLRGLSRVTPDRTRLFNRVVRTLLKGTTDPSGWVRAEALSQLFRMRNKKLWPRVRRSLKDPHLGARLASLKFIRSRKLLRGECRKLAVGEDLFMALRAAVVLSRRPDSQDLELAEKALMRASKDGQWSVRAAACNAALTIGAGKPARQVIVGGLADRHPRVRMAAARAGLALGIDRKKAIETLVDLIRSRPELAVPAAHILALRRVSAGLPWLEKLARKGTEAQKTSAVTMLGTMRKGLGAVLYAWGRGTFRVRLAADRALWKWHRR